MDFLLGGGLNVKILENNGHRTKYTIYVLDKRLKNKGEQSSVSIEFINRKTVVEMRSDNIVGGRVMLVEAGGLSRDFGQCSVS